MSVSISNKTVMTSLTVAENGDVKIDVAFDVKGVAFDRTVAWLQRVSDDIKSLKYSKRLSGVADDHGITMRSDTNDAEYRFGKYAYERCPI